VKAFRGWQLRSWAAEGHHHLLGCTPAPRWSQLPTRRIGLMGSPGSKPALLPCCPPTRPPTWT
jgi:hypothetical protein